MHRLVRSTLLAAMVAATAPAFAQTDVNMATVSESSDDYQLAIAWSNILVKEGKYRIVPDGGSGTVKGLRLLAQGRVQLSPIGAPHYADAINRSGSFKDDPAELVESYKKLRALFAIPTGMAQYVVRADSPIKSIADLKGKRVAIGRPGGNAGLVTTFLYRAHGLDIDKKDFSAEYLDYGPALEELGDGKLDASLVWGGVPHSAVYNLSRATKVRFVSPDPAKLDAFRALVSNGQHYVFRQISPEVLKTAYGDGVDIGEPMYVWTFPMMIMASGDMSEGDAYALTAALWDNIAGVKAASQQLNLLDMATATDALSVPLHPGAEKYFREKGVVK